MIIKLQHSKFLADMGISQATVKWLNEQGRDAIHARDVGMCRSLDAEILSRRYYDAFINNDLTSFVNETFLK